MSVSRMIAISSVEDLEFISQKSELISGVISGENNLTIVFCGQIIVESSTLTKKNISLLIELKLKLKDKFVIVIDELSLHFYVDLLDCFYSDFIEEVSFSHEKQREKIHNVLDNFFPYIVVPDFLFSSEFSPFLKVINFIESIDEKYNRLFTTWTKHLEAKFFNLATLEEDINYKNSKDLVEILNTSSEDVSDDVYRFVYAAIYIFKDIRNIFNIFKFVFLESVTFFSCEKSLFTSINILDLEVMESFEHLFSNSKKLLSDEDVDIYPMKQLFNSIKTYNKKTSNHISSTFIEEISLKYKFLVYGGLSLADVPVPVKFNNNLTIIFSNKKNCIFSKREMNIPFFEEELLEGKCSPISTIAIFGNEFLIKGKTSSSVSYLIREPGEILICSLSYKYENPNFTSKKYWIFIKGVGFYNLACDKTFFRKEIESISKNILKCSAPLKCLKYAKN